MVICLDCDNVLNNLADKVVELYNARNNTDIKVSDITTYDFACLPEQVASSFFQLFKEKELWDSLTPPADAQQTIKTLMNLGHRIIIATATNPINFYWKVGWIAKYYPFIDPDNIIRIVDKSLLKCDVMVDDYLDNLTGNLCERIVINKPWNQSATKDFVYDIYRANNLKDVINIIKDIEVKQEKWK